MKQELLPVPLSPQLCITLLGKGVTCGSFEDRYQYQQAKSFVIQGKIVDHQLAGNCKSASVFSSTLLSFSTKLQSGLPGREKDLSQHFQQHTDSQLGPSVFCLIAFNCPSCLNILYLYTILQLFCHYFFFCISKIQLLLSNKGVSSERPRACGALCFQRLFLPGKGLHLIFSVAHNPDWDTHTLEPVFSDSAWKLCLLAHGASIGQLAC